jgi:hypothetical protein
MLSPLRPHTRKVAGSTPAASTNTFVDGIRLCSEVFAAQGIPHVDLCIRGSVMTASPAPGRPSHVPISRLSLLNFVDVMIDVEVSSITPHKVAFWKDSAGLILGDNLFFLQQWSIQ